MVNFLQKPPSPSGGKGQGKGLRVRDSKGALSKNSGNAYPLIGQRNGRIPNASIIYGLSSAVMLVIGLFTIFYGSWFTGLLICIMAAALFGFAAVYVRYQSRE